jgi:hypothetical protein
MKNILNFQMCYLLCNAWKKPGSFTYREVEITPTISPGLKLGQGVVHCVPQPLLYNIADMQKLTPNIHEVIAFTKWLSAKQILPRSAKSEVCAV